MSALIPRPSLGKRPRHYAAEIIALPSREARLAALARVPDLYRDWVNELVQDYFAKRHFLERYRHVQCQKNHTFR